MLSSIYFNWLPTLSIYSFINSITVSHRAPPQVADRVTLTRYGGYRGNKITGWTKTSTAAQQFDIDLSRARGRKP